MKKIYELIKTAELISQRIMKGQGEVVSSEFDEWLNDSKDNRKLYDRIRNKKNIELRNVQFNSVNTEIALKNILSQINRKSRKIRFLKFTRRVAAVLLPFIIGGLMLYFFYGENEQIIINTKDISPGERGAVLILNDGNSIDLKAHAIKHLNEKDGTIIRKVNDELQYFNNKFAEIEPEPKEQLINTLITSRGNEYSLFLSDSTKVYVNSMSKLRFPVQFLGKQREVFLDEGEAFFEVEKDLEGPFIVHIKGMKIEVLGTSFNIKAYADEDNIYTTLLEGKIKVEIKDEQGGEIILFPDQQMIVDINTNNYSVRKVDAKLFAQWKDGIYSFTYEPLEDIIRTLSRWYAMEYEFEDESLKKIRFEGGLNKYDEISPILDIIQSTDKVKVKIKGKKIIFM